MTIRNLNQLFRPKSVAVIGARTRERTVGRTLIDNLLAGGFSGPVLPVNPKHRSICGVMSYPDVASLPQTPDLAVIATPPASVPGLIADLGARGTRAAVVVTAGFGEGGGGDGARRRQAMLDAARPHLLRILGPNCLGVMVPGIGLNASFAHRTPLAGGIAFVAQSGAMVTSVLDWASSRRIGFSHLISLGDMSDVDFGDMLDYLAHDHETRAILLYIEAITHARKFMSAARAAARLKPVIVVKAGRSAEGAKAATTHTGALAGADAVYDAAFRRAGMLRVGSLEALFAAVATLASRRLPAGDRLAILTNGGGMGVLATDVLIEEGGRLAALGDDARSRLDAVLPATWSHDNPVDIIGDATPDRYAAALEAVIDTVDCDGVLVLNCPTAISPSEEAAAAVADVAASVKGRKRSVLTCWVGGESTASARRIFAEREIATYDTPGDAVRAFLQMASYRRNQNLLMQTPPSEAARFSPKTGVAERLLHIALDEQREWLSEIEAKRVLAAYGIPTVATEFAATPAEAGVVAGRLDLPVAVKIVSPDITHKSDIGGVALDLRASAAVVEAAEVMLKRVAKARPEARIEGFAVQPMVRRPHAYEIIVGVADDSLFGPVIMFGQGGTAVEVVADQAVALPPLNLVLAREVMARTRVYRLLQGYRDRPAADLASVELVLMKVSQMVVDLDHLAELDINPLLVDEFGAIALDARIRVRRPARGGTERLAIRPYPKELEQRIVLSSGERIFLRPIRPEDEAGMQDAFKRLSPHDVRMRFFAPIKSLTHDMAARLTQIDYDREMAFVALRDDGAGEPLGVGRLYADPDNERAEYAITVLSDAQGIGLGHALMDRLIGYARRRGTASVVGRVLWENTAMLKLCREFGFQIAPSGEEPGVVDVRLELGGPAAAPVQAASRSSA